MLHRDPLPDGRTRLTFILPQQEPAGDVSVVGDFNDWVPGRHPLQAVEDGTRLVSVIVEPGMHQFRYLATGGVWADEPDADSVTAAGSIIDCPAVVSHVEVIEAVRPVAAPVAPVTTVAAPAKASTAAPAAAPAKASAAAPTGKAASSRSRKKTAR